MAQFWGESSLRQARSQRSGVHWGTVIVPSGPLPPLGGYHRPGMCNIAMFDGSTRIIDLRKVSETTLRHAITADDGQSLGPDWGQ